MRRATLAAVLVFVGCHDPGVAPVAPAPLECDWREAYGSPHVHTGHACFVLIGHGARFTPPTENACDGVAMWQCAVVEPGFAARAWVPVDSTGWAVERVDVPCNALPPCP